MNHDLFIKSLESALGKDLPGTDVQWEMASSERRIENYPRHKKKGSQLAAVLMLLYPYMDDIYTVFIQRPLYEGVHSGQISFPGGKMEEGDRSLVETASREACEEISLCDNELLILGMLTPLYIPVSDIEASPVVAFCNYKPDLAPDKNEVVSIIEARLKDFLDPGIIKEKLMKIRDEEIMVKYFDHNGLVIWGATAMMLYELLVILEREGIDIG